jgi:hypothetical protein
MSAWETYWTAGYTVRGASDVIVNRYCRTKDIASREADAAAEADKVRLIELGIEATIDIWVEKWRTRYVEEHDERESVGEFTSPRRTERVDLAHAVIPPGCRHRWEYGDGVRTCPGCGASELSASPDATTQEASRE